MKGGEEHHYHDEEEDGESSERVHHADNHYGDEDHDVRSAAPAVFKTFFPSRRFRMPNWWHIF